MMNLKSTVVLTLVLASGMSSRLLPAQQPSESEVQTEIEMQTAPDDLGFNIDTSEFDSFGTDEFNADGDLDPAEEAAATAVIAAISLLCIVLACVGLLFAIFVAYQLSSSLSAIPEQYRQMAPFMPWLIFIPVVGIVIQILAFIKVPRSLSQYLASVGDNSLGDCGEKQGLWGNVLCLIGCTAPIGVVLVVLSVLKIGKAKKLAMTRSTA